MEQWRERGYVPDSDEDDDFESQQEVEEPLERQNENADASATQAEESRQATNGPDVGGIDDVRLANEHVESNGNQDTKLSDSTQEERTGLATTKRQDEVGPANPEITRVKDGVTEEPHIFVQIPEVHVQSNGTGALRAADDDNELDGDPLQSGNGVKIQRLKRGHVNTFYKEATKTASCLATNEMEPSSSPDEIQFAEHFRHRRPQTPVRQSSQSSPVTPKVRHGSLSLSSPSSVLTSLRSTPSLNNMSPGHRHDDTGQDTSLNKDPGISSVAIPDEPTATAHHGRVLRPRNPAQLNPFLVDLARYEKACREAGIRPERFHGFGHSAHRRTNESQEDEFQDRNASQSSTSSQSFEFASSSPIVGKNQRTYRRSVGARRQPDRNSQHVPKRRARDTGPKTTYSGSKRHRLSHAGDLLGTGNLAIPNKNYGQVVNDNNVIGRGLTESLSIFDVPVSPPPSGSPSTTPTDQGNPTFRFPRGFSPVLVPTPVTEKRPTRGSSPIENNVDLVSSPQPVIVDQDSAIQEGVPSHSDDGSSEDEMAELRRMQRKIKGVLPASWLRLDLKAQQERARLQAKERLKRRRNNRPSGKGVAQRISRKRKTDEGRPVSITLEDSGSESEESDKGQCMSIQGSVSGSATFNVLKNDDIPEDNRIDYMYPPATRRQTTSTARVSKSKGTSGVPSRRGSNQRPRAPRQTRVTDSINWRPAPKTNRFRIPRLGILDSPDVRNLPIQNQPQFLRIAARQARSRRDRGRASPTRKFFRLGTKADTEDANAALRHWREGTIVPAPDASSSNQKLRSGPNAFPYLEPDHEESVISLVRPERDGVQSASSVVSRNGTRVSRDAAAAADGSLDGIQMVSPNSRKHSGPRANKQQRWVVRKGYVVSSLKRSAPRPADLDDRSIRSTRPHPVSSFQQSLSALDAAYRSTRQSHSGHYSLPLARFLAHSNTSARRTHQSPKIAPTDACDGTSDQQRHVRRQVPRKRRPQHVNAETLEYRQPSVQLQESESASVISVDEVNVPSLRGLRSLGSIYSVDFDISPLQLGTYFHESTFIGSTAFARSLRISTRDMDVSCGHATIFHNGKAYRWGYWNETTSSEVETLFDTAIDALCTPERIWIADVAGAASNLLELYKSIICYINDNLSFLDPIDRRMFVDKFLTLLAKAIDIGPLDECDGQPGSSGTDKVKESYLRFQMFNLVLANQVRQVAAHNLVEKAKLSDLTNAIAIFATRIFNMIVADARMKNVRRFLEENKVREQREAGIKDQHPFIEAYLIAHEIVYNQGAEIGLRMDDPFSNVLIESISAFHSQKDVRYLENVWLALFSTLPLHELDEFGIVRPGLRFQKKFDRWQVVKQLVSQVFTVYEASPETQPVYLKNYIRTLFHRCFHLIQSWGWHHSKPILEALFDFFARNMLHNLHNEETHGSPAFLDELDRDPPIEIDPGDSCFHALLKIIAVGLRLMANHHEKKHIRNLAWRLLPNHGRNYPKEEPLRQQDLDALRNHHDLLCTLYSSTPVGCRPRLETIRNLVHPANSHGEACSINIHTWLRLIKFKLSTDDGDSDLAEFAKWHSHFTVEILKQHSLARTEMEAQSLGSLFSRQFVESTISVNQRRIESLVSSCLACMKSGLDATRNMDQAKTLIEDFPLKKLLSLFNPKSRRIAPIICQALDIVISFVAIDSRPCTSDPQIPLDTSDDSQEYGDWSGLAEIYDEEMQDLHPAVHHIDSVFRPTVSQFMSRCFGEDQAPDDTVLLKVIDCWTSIAHVLVRHKLRQWSSYLNPYDTDSWSSLRSTDQTRRFTPHFLSRMVEKDPSAYIECEPQLLTCWLVSLVERGSMLKYQHQLTNALLNEGRTNPLLKNLPFAVNKSTKRYEITLEEFCQRRISLISCVLSNMREHLFEVEHFQVDVRQSMGDQYRGMIEALMAAMKRNYQELGTGNDPVRGSYVDFVHRIVGFLQQHSQGICPLDGFFTDPTSFPLPASDPTYIVAKLKGYGVRLFTGKVAKQLVTFIQLVAERAAMDSEQDYLVDQLYNAMSHTFEIGNYHQPTLRLFLLHCVIPAYIKTSFTNPTAWLLVRPFLQSTTRMFSDFILDIDLVSTENVRHIVELVRAYFDAVDHTLQLLVDHPGLLEEPSVLLTLTSFLETIIASFTVVDYLDRASDEAAILVAYVEHFKRFVLFAIASLLDPATAVAPNSFDVAPDEYGVHGNQPLPSPPTYFSEARDFAARELQSGLRDRWFLHDGKYFVRWGQQSKEVYIDPACRSIQVARGLFVRTVEIFFGMMEAFDTFATE
ncbi:hypothetical protein VTO42DRAFT_1180 [Malbranchea cinnamomea]